MIPCKGTHIKEKSKDVEERFHPPTSDHRVRVYEYYDAPVAFSHAPSQLPNNAIAPHRLYSECTEHRRAVALERVQTNNPVSSVVRLGSGNASLPQLQSAV
jgi:hypothetical protein